MSPRHLVALSLVVLALLTSCSTANDAPRDAPTSTPAPSLTSSPLPSPTPRATSTAIPTPTPLFISPEQVKPLALKDLFPPRDLTALRLDPARLRVLIATGDVVPARKVDREIRNRKDDFLFPIAATKDLLAAGDVTVVNLEAPLIAKCPAHETGFTLCGRPGFVAALQVAGVDVVTLENNHIANYGRAGIAETIKHLEAAKMAWVDQNTPVIRDVRGRKFGFLAFNGVGSAINRTHMVNQTRSLRPKVDVIVAAIHWGAEYETFPQVAPGIAPDNPIEIAHLAVDAGADLIIGNHPHQVQGVEIYKGKFIAYAHGNFIFDQMWSYGTRVGVIGRYTFYDNVLVRAEYVPVLIEDFAKPVPMQGKEAQGVLDQMKGSSEEIARRVGARQ